MARPEGETTRLLRTTMDLRLDEVNARLIAAGEKAIDATALSKKRDYIRAKDSGRRKGKTVKLKTVKGKGLRPGQTKATKLNAIATTKALREQDSQALLAQISKQGTLAPLDKGVLRSLFLHLLMLIGTEDADVIMRDHKIRQNRVEALVREVQAQAG